MQPYIDQKRWRIPICLGPRASDVIPPYSGTVVVTHRSLYLQINVNGTWKTIDVLKKNRTAVPHYITSDGINVRFFNPGKVKAYAYPKFELFI